MLIVCPSCISTYRIPEAISSGDAVRCAECGAVFEACDSVLADRVPASSVGHSKAAALSIAPPVLLPGMRAMRASYPPPPENARSQGRGRLIAVGLVVMLTSGMVGVAQRASVVRLWPGSAPLFAAIGLPATAPDLVLGGVASALADDGPARVLTLEGKITNERGTEADVPNLRIVVRDDDQQSLYSWVAPPPRPRLGAGESVEFSSRLVSPPANGHDLVVSFADGTDGGTATKVKASR